MNVKLLSKNKPKKNLQKGTTTDIASFHFTALVVLAKKYDIRTATHTQPSNKTVLASKHPGARTRPSFLLSLQPTCPVLSQKQTKPSAGFAKHFLTTKKSSQAVFRVQIVSYKLNSKLLFRSTEAIFVDPDTRQPRQAMANDSESNGSFPEMSKSIPTSLQSLLSCKSQ